MTEQSTFFERDLSEAEAERLDAAILADPAVAEALLAEAERRYSATGLPRPRWDERRAKRLPKGWWLAALLLAGGAVWALSLRETRARVVDVPNVDGEMPLVERRADLERGQDTVEIRVQPTLVASAVPHGQAPAAAPQKGRQLGVVLHLKEAAQVQVEVRDTLGRVRRRLFSGQAASGERRYVWDGLDEGRKAVEAGEYRIVVRTGGREQVQMVRIKKQG